MARWVLGLGVCLALAGAVPACSSPSLDGSTRFSCSSDADCRSDEVCGSVGGERACVASATSPIRIGMSGPFQGPSSDLGVEMRRGISVMFENINASGGIHGRELELVTQNDNYDPEDAVVATQALLDIQEAVDDPDQPDVRGPNSVFALLGNIGTPTMLATAPLATKNEVVFFAPFTGAQRYLRDGTNSPYVYNYRAGYFQETQAMIDYIATYRVPRVISEPAGDSYKRILVFQQDDSYGDSGYEGVVNAYNRVSPLPTPDAIRRIRYTRDRVESVEPAVAEAQRLLTDILAESGSSASPVSVAIIMIDTYQPADKFIRGLKDWINADAERARALDVVFMNVSFVGSDSLAEALTSSPGTYPDVLTANGTPKSYAQGVMVMQVVPYYSSQAPAIADYRADIARYDGGKHSFTSLEGYIVARLFARALEMAGSNVTTDSFLQTLDNRIKDMDIGIGTLLNFSPASHQASHTVWGSSIEADGSFSVPFIWNPTDHIQPN